MDTHSEIMMPTAARFVPGLAVGLCNRRTLNLALSGSTHSALTWGMLDRLLDEPGLFFAGIAASGFDALNAAVFAYGLTLGGRRGAQTALANFWRRISHAAISGPLRLSLYDQAGGLAMSNEIRLLSDFEHSSRRQPDPLQSLLRAAMDIEAMQTARQPVELSVRARNARTGADRVFAGNELSIDAIVAAATTPFLFQPVEIDGELYWSSGTDAELVPMSGLDDIADLLLASNTVFDHRTSTRHRLQPGRENDWGSLIELRDIGRARTKNWLAANCGVFAE